MLPLGMVWLGDYLVLIQECGFSIVVDIEPLEILMTTNAKFSQYPQGLFQFQYIIFHLLNRIFLVYEYII